jgi:hypothetical protein
MRKLGRRGLQNHGSGIEHAPPPVFSSFCKDYTALASQTKLQTRAGVPYDKTWHCDCAFDNETCSRCTVEISNLNHSVSHQDVRVRSACCAVHQYP